MEEWKLGLKKERAIQKRKKYIVLFVFGGGLSVCWVFFGKFEVSDAQTMKKEGKYSLKLCP